MVQQIGLDFGFLPDYSMGNYYVPEPVSSPLNILLNTSIWGNPALLICGEVGAGKTHLCHIYADKFSVPMVSGDTLDIDILPSLSETGCVVDSIDGADETLLFHLLNMVKENNKNIVMSSQHTVHSMGIVLPDLVSRLSQSMIIALDLPDDDILATVLIKHFSDRKLRLSSEVVSYIMTRMPRSYSGVALLVKILDETALEQRKNITIPFVRKVLDTFMSPDVCEGTQS